MRCPECGVELSVPEMVCPLCGVTYRGCPHCWTLTDVREPFCPFCGRPLTMIAPRETDDWPADETPPKRARLLEIDEDTPLESETDERFTVAALSEQHAKARKAHVTGAELPTRLEQAKAVLAQNRELLPRKDSPWESGDWWWWMLPWPWWGYPYYYHPAMYLGRLVVLVVCLVFYFIYVYPQLAAFRTVSEPGMGPSWLLTGPILVGLGTVLVVVIYGVFTWLMIRSRSQR